jgi:hypothetical protein
VSPAVHDDRSGLPPGRQAGGEPCRITLPRLPRGQWLRLVEEEAQLALRRSDALKNLLMVAWVIGGAANKRTLRSRPTIAQIMAVTGLSKRCVQYHCRWLEEHGLLAVLEPGTTPRFRPGLLARGHAGNLAREWQLTVPPVERSCTPPVVLDLEKIEDPPAHAREAPVIHMARAPHGQPPAEQVKTPEARAPRGLPLLPRAHHVSPHDHPKTRSKALAAAALVQDRSAVAGGLSARYVRHLVRVFFAAGWTAADVLHALERDPDDRVQGHTDPVRSPAGWLRARLARWLDLAGAPLPSVSQLRAAAEQHRIAEQEMRRAAAVNAAGVDSAGPAAHARQVLEAASPAAARVIREMRARQSATFQQVKGPAGSW